MSTPLFQGPEFVVNTTPNNTSTEPRAAALADGRFVGVWTGADSSGAGILGQLFTSDGSLTGPAFAVNTTTPGSQNQPIIAALPDGGFVVAWTDSSQSGDDTSGRAVRGQVFDADGDKAGSEFLVNTITASDQGGPRITALSDGRFVIGWGDASRTPPDTSGQAARAQIFEADGTKAGPEILVNSPAPRNQGLVAPAPLDDGRFVFAWFDQNGTGDGSGAGIRAQIFDSDGAKSGPEFLVNTITPGDQSHPWSAGLSDGRFVVAWMDTAAAGGTQTSDGASTTRNAMLRAQVFEADGARSGAEILVSSTMPPWHYQQLMVAPMPDGRFVLAWSDQGRALGDTSGSAIHAQVFAPDGTRVGDEVRVNTTTAGNQRHAGVTTFDDGRMLFTWTDTDTRNVHAQLFATEPLEPVAPIVIDGPETEAQVLQSGGTLHVLPDGALNVYEATAVTTADARAHSTEVRVEGLIYGHWDDAVLLTGTQTGTPEGRGGHRVEVAAGGRIRNSDDRGLVLGGTDNRVTNAGEITGLVWGVESTGTVEIDNAGLIGGSNAALALGPGADLVVNTGTLDGWFEGVVSTGTVEIENAGLISGRTAALALGPGADRVVNTGTLDGAVDLGEGDNLLDSRDGVLTGAVTAGRGDDTIIGSAGGDTLSGGHGRDRIFGLDGADLIEGGELEDVLRGGAGNDTIHGGINADTIHGGSGDDVIHGDSGLDVIDGASGNDTIYGDTGHDTIRGGSGDDVIDAGWHDDSVEGGAGDDVIHGDSGQNTLDGGTGRDTIHGGIDQDLILGGTNDDLLYGGRGDDTIHGGSNADTIHGGPGDDALHGDSGLDVIYGGAGNDTIHGGTGFDMLDGGSGDDMLYGGNHADTLRGTLGNDWLDGGSGDDLLYGGSDDDTLIGGAGRDTLYGGPGADVFVFATASDSPHGARRDVIRDFTPGEDRIDLSGLGPGLSFVASYSGAGNEVRYNDVIGRLYVDLDGGASDFSIDLTGAPSLSAGDLLL